jgi:hypothetical protein
MVDVLADAADRERWVALFVRYVVLIAAVLIGFVLVTLVKRRFKKPDEVGTNFTLADLRAMHRSGQLSKEEFERAKQRVLGHVKKDDRPRDNL